MLCVETAVPVYAREIKAEFAVLFVLDNIHIRVTSKELVRKRPELALRSHILGLSDHGAKRWVLVQEDLCNKVSPRDELFAEVQLGYWSVLQSRSTRRFARLTNMSHLRKALRNFLE